MVAVAVAAAAVAAAAVAAAAVAAAIAAAVAESGEAAAVKQQKAGISSSSGRRCSLSRRRRRRRSVVRVGSFIGAVALAAGVVAAISDKRQRIMHFCCNTSGHHYLHLLSRVGRALQKDFLDVPIGFSTSFCVHSTVELLFRQTPRKEC